MCVRTLDCLLLVRFVRAVDCLVLVGSAHPLGYSLVFGCVCVHGICEIFFLRAFFMGFCLFYFVKEFHWGQKLLPDVFVMYGGVVFFPVVGVVSWA